MPRKNQESIDLNDRGLTTVPPEVGRCTGLKRLFLNNNRLVTLPPEISELSKLQGLYLRNNQLTMLPPEIGGLTKLRWLFLTGNHITTMPTEIENLTCLQRLNLTENKLTSLPKAICSLVRLQTLDLGGNHLTTLPPEFGQLSNVHQLSLEGNELTVLPPEIGRLTKLQMLDLKGNKLTALPREIGLLTNLQTLDLRGNNLTTLPAEIGSLGSLQRLILDNNILTSLPPEIGQLFSLHQLNVEGNKLKVLPTEIGHLNNLQILEVRGNQLTTPPPEIVSQGTSAILAYLQEELQDSRKQWVSKLLVVGEGGVGKTSLLRALRDEPFDTHESTTHGIEIKSLPIKHPTEPDVTMQLNTWDFGGQEIYHATHQFFLTNRSLFLLAWNARLGFEQGKVYYWLDTIKARAPESPVLIVATYIDERDADIPLAELRRKYPQIVGHCEISNKTGAGIEPLRDAISSAAATLPLMGETWPTNWLNAANAIRSRHENYITPRHLYGIMSDRDVSPEKGKVLTQWLHELGDILYFRDDPELNDTVILDPQWVTQSISRVLESEKVINNLGLFTRDHMDELWSDIDPAMREHFLRLMEKFDLSYKTLENKDISLVVERLNLNPPDYEEVWRSRQPNGSGNQISMKFVIDTTMPAGIPTWFIARSHRFTTRTHWRYGALFSDGVERKHLGLIQALPHDRYLKLTVRGSTPHNFFALLLDGLEVTLKRFPGLRIDRRIPCPGHNGQSCPHEFDLVNLQRAIERKPPILEIQCPVSFEDISVPRLLMGLPWATTDQVITTQYREIRSEIRSLRGEVEEIGKLAQREFVKLFHREQERIESYCPNIFVIRPNQSRSWLRRILERIGILKARNILGQKLELQLYCQAPGQWHPTESGGLYPIDQPAPWLRTMTPYIRRMALVLKYATPVIGPWIGILSADYFKEQFEKDLRLMEELVERLPELESSEAIDTSQSRMAANDESRQVADGAALRTLRRLLDEKDSGHRWGGLKRILTPEGHYLWLCSHHSEEYTQ